MFDVLGPTCMSGVKVHDFTVSTYMYGVQSCSAHHLINPMHCLSYFPVNHWYLTFTVHW